MEILKETQHVSDDLTKSKESNELVTDLQEFSIIELDERLEFTTWCNNCSC